MVEPRKQSAIESFGPGLVLVRRLAAGGMAEVFRARQTGVGGFEKTVAVKRILPQFASDDDFKQMFQYEVNLCARFQHPNIVQVFSNGEAAGYLFLVMEFVDGRSVAQLFKTANQKSVAIPVPVAVYTVAEAAKGLDYAHRYADERTNQCLNVIHRDVSPQNIMLSYDGQVKMVDFGIAKAADRAELTQTGSVKGKVSYMSPEQALGYPLDPRTDVFSLGIVLYELLTQKYLFRQGSPQETLRKIRECHVAPPSAANPLVDAELEAIVMRSLTRDREQRYASAKDFYRDLGVYLNGKFPTFLPTDLSDFMKALFANEIQADRENQASLSAELPTAMHSATPSASRLRSGSGSAHGGSGSGRLPLAQVGGGQLAGDAAYQTAQTRTPTSSARAFVPIIAPPERARTIAGLPISVAAILAVVVLILGTYGAVKVLSNRGGALMARLPHQVEGLLSWYRADTIVAENGDAIRMWRDEGALGMNAEQADEERQPVLRKGMINGLPVVTFDGTDDYLSADRISAGLRNSRSMTVLWVSRARSDRTHFVWSAHLADRTYDVCRAGYAKGERLRMKTTGVLGAEYLESEREVIYGFSVFSAVLEPSAARLFLDGVQKVEAPIGKPVDYANAMYFSLGMEWDDGNPTDHFDGDIAEMMVYDRALSDTDRHALEAYLGKKYGITLNME